MKLDSEGIKSVGKILEVIPIIEDAMGTPMMLPPAYWHVDNWILGFQDNHIIRTPLSFWSMQKTEIPGSVANRGHRLTYMTRILEDGEMPNGVPVGHIDAEAVRELIQAVRIAPDVYRGDS